MSEETEAALRALPGWSNDKAPAPLEDRETSSVYVGRWLPSLATFLPSSNQMKCAANSSDSGDAGGKAACVFQSAHRFLTRPVAEPSPEHAYSIAPNEVAEDAGIQVISLATQNPR